MVNDNVELGVLSSFVERYAYMPSANDEHLPKNFPFSQWVQQATRYAQNWNWYSGNALAQTRLNEKGEEESQYPLHINSLRAFVRKHAAVLFGEVPDGPAPLVKTVVRPRKRFDGQPVKEEDKSFAEMCESLINEVWVRSNGRAMQLENGKLSQFLGGSVFELDYKPQRKDLLIPIVISNPRTDYFMPEWSNDDYWSLLRGTCMYQIPAVTAKMEYGIGDGDINNYSVVIKSKTPTTNTVTIDGTPLRVGDKEVNPKHNFGFTSAVYIPHVLEGAKYGPSHVEDVAALLKEYNARFSDLGTAVLNTVDRETYVSNVMQITPVTLPTTGKVVNNLGSTPPASGSKDAPNAWQEQAPVVNQFMKEFMDMLWRQMMRDCDMSGIPFGEDEGSQRSGETLALRMWPILSHTREERTHWNDGLTRFGWYILKMINQIMQDNPAVRDRLTAMGVEFPKDWEFKIDISTQWSPQIPQDRTKLVTELATLGPVGFVSTETGVEMLGNTKDNDAEVAAIKQDQKQAADLASQQNQPFGGKPSNGASSASPSNGTSSNGTTAPASSPKTSVN